MAPPRWSSATAIIACLAATLPRHRGRLCDHPIQLGSLDRQCRALWRHRRGVHPNPIAIGIPTEGDPILIDISASITTNGMTGRLHGEGKTLPMPGSRTPPA